MRQLSAWLWRLPVGWRRALLFVTTVGVVAFIGLKLSGGLFLGPADGLTAALCALFVVLAAFTTAAWLLRIFGFVLGASRPPQDTDTTGLPTTPTAIVMPIYHEDVARVAAGIERTWLSAKACGLDALCDFYLLSDSTDEAIKAEEEAACLRLLAHFDQNRQDTGRLFLERREERSNYKAGNVANFVRLHGAGYEFMLIFDADSMMTGERIRQLIRKLEQRPGTALIQSLMTIYRGRTLFARVMQTSQNPQMALYSTGLRWFLGTEGIYWGHNALARIRPFADHAMLPEHPGKAPGGGPVLSQDVHEAFLLGRAGWAVDLDLDEGGSYEEMPANVLSYAERDRRWCQGDYLNLSLIFSRGARPGQRLWLFYIFIGYFMSLLVAGLMLLGSMEVCRRTPTGAGGAGWLVLLNMYLMQLSPKALAFGRSVRRHGLGRYGVGTFLLDTLASILLTPLMLYLHMVIVVGLLCGKARPWKSPSRDPDDEVPWTTAAKVFWPVTVVGWVWLAVLWAKAPSYLLFCGPVIVMWCLSIPLAALTSKVGLADWLARRGLFRAYFTHEEEEALGPLVLEADRAVPMSIHAEPLRGQNAPALDGHPLAPPPGSVFMKLGDTTVRLCAGGVASTKLGEVKQSLISAQRLLLLLGLAVLWLLATLRYLSGR